MRSFDPTPPFPIELPVLGGKEVEQQPIVGTAVDVVAWTLPADEAEAEALYGPERRVSLDGPRVDRMKAEIAERERHEFRAGDGRIAAVAEGFLPAHPPEHRGFEGAIDAVQADDADGNIVPIRGIDSQKMGFPLRHDLEQRGRDGLSSVPEVQPLVILFPGKPARGQLKRFGRVQG